MAEDSRSEYLVPIVIDLWPRWTECTICGKDTPLELFIPMYEGKKVDTAKSDDWAGMPVCKECFDKDERESKRATGIVGITFQDGIVAGGDVIRERITKFYQENQDIIAGIKYVEFKDSKTLIEIFERINSNKG